MITAKVKFRCKLCNNAQSFYVMPLKEKTKTGDFINCLDKYNLQCKKCGKNYILEIKIKTV